MTVIPIDRDESLTALARRYGIEQRGVISGTRLYRFRDAKGRLLYVGITCSIPDRWIQHRRSHWWRMVDTVEISEPYGWTCRAEDAEREAIRSERPIFNRRSRIDHCPTHVRLSDRSRKAQ